MQDMFIVDTYWVEMSLLAFFFCVWNRCRSFQDTWRIYILLIRKIWTPISREITRFLLSCSWNVHLEYPSHSHILYEITSLLINSVTKYSKNQWVSVVDVLSLVLRAMASQRLARGGRSYKPRHSKTSEVSLRRGFARCGWLRADVVLISKLQRITCV